MDGDGRDYDGTEGIPSQDCKTNCEDDGSEGRRQGKGVGLGGHSYGGDRDLDNKVVRAEAAGENCGLCHREADL